MSLIKISANGIAINFVKETLTIRKENTALSRDFSVNHNSVPFLVIEDENAKTALGPKDITSINKPKTVEVMVNEGGFNYFGELQILSYPNGFRKCNLKYATELLTIMNRKISEFMPVISVSGDTTPIPYSESSPAIVAGHDEWQDFVADLIDKNFPDVKYQFPKMEYKALYGDDLTEEDSWWAFGNTINNYNDDMELVENLYVQDETSVDVLNRNSISPQVFLLAPLFYALQSIGFKIAGGFYDNEFIRRLVILNLKSQMCEVVIYPENYSDLTFDGSWDEWGLIFPYTHYRKLEDVAQPDATTILVQYRFVLPEQLLSGAPEVKTSFRVQSIPYGFGTTVTEVAFNADTNSANQVFEGEIELNVVSGGVLRFLYISLYQEMPVEYEIKFGTKGAERTYQMMHPTIHLSRFVPDWTVASYINAIKNFFNLEITIDDFMKTLSINFNEQKISDAEKIIIAKSLHVATYDQAPFNAFLLKYENDEDAALWITSEGAEIYSAQRSDFSETLDSKFKFVPSNGYTAKLSVELAEKDGVGLMIYNPLNAPFISSEFEGQTLKIDGVGGIFDVFWKKFLKFRLNGSILEMAGPFSDTELAKILKLQRIYIDHQEYIIASTSYSETKQDNFLVKFSVVSVNY